MDSRTVKPTFFVGAARIFNSLGDVLKATQEEGRGGQNGKHTAEHAVVGAGADVLVDGHQVVDVKLHEAADHGQHTHADEENAQHFLQAGSQVGPLVVDVEKEQGNDGPHNDVTQINIRASQNIQRCARLQGGEEDGSDVYDIDGFPGHEGKERAQREPACHIGGFLTKRPVGECGRAACHGEHGDQLGET